MTREELDALKAESLRKYNEYLSAAHELEDAIEDKSLIDRSSIDNLRKKKREWDEAQSVWEDGLLVYLFEEREKKLRGH